MIRCCRRSAGRIGSGNCIMSPPVPEDFMHICSRFACGLAALALTAATAHLAAEPHGKAPIPAAQPNGSFQLTVDSIMRGPKLVGYPPTGLRWSGDSSRLYFEWRRPGADEPSTWA